MVDCVDKVKLHIDKLLRNNKSEEDVGLGVVETSTPPICTNEVHEARSDDRQGYSRGLLAYLSPSIPAPGRLDHIGSWPAWRQQLDLHRTGYRTLSRSWVLERIPDPTPFRFLKETEDIMAALALSYKNCIFEGPGWSSNPGSVLHWTRLGRIPRFGCCPLCKSVATTVRFKSSVQTSSSSREVVIWCADWGSFEQDESNVAVVAKAFQNRGVFLTKG